MRSERVQTHLRCNQRCAYCVDRRPTDEPAFIRRDAVEARIAAARAAGADEIVLGGGEPTLRRDLPALVARARALGASRVALETNATVIDAPLSHALAAAGLGRALVNLAGDGAWIDTLTADPGGFEATVRGIEALLEAGVPVDVQAVVVGPTAARLPALPGWLATRFGGRLGTLYLTVPTQSPDPSLLLGYDEAGAVVRQVAAAARAHGVSVKLAPDSGPPPCVHGHEPHVAHLYALTSGAGPRADHRHLETCAGCAVHDRCPGVSERVLARHGAPTMRPITTDRARRRLSLISTVEAQVARELVQPNRHRDPERGDVDEAIVRVVFQCNQACRFCFVSTHLPTAEDAAIERAIRDAAAAGRKITLSGGEPTLHPRLPSFVALARSLSPHPVLLQTNAIRLAEPGAAEALAEAGLAEAFVSLHGASAAVADAVTSAPGTFEKTVRGLDRLVAAGIRVSINFVICQANLHELGAWVDLVAGRWPGAFANVSFVAPSTDLVPREHALVPRYTDALPALADAVARAEAKGLALGGFESMCGVPLCLVPHALARSFTLSEVGDAEGEGELVRAAACEGCALATRCVGVRRGYVELHGDAELRRVEPHG